nr:MAG TPA: UBA-like domain protein [Caudoviricetes sp.]
MDMKNSTQILVQKIYEILLLPHAERVQPMTEINQSLLSLGYNEKQVRQIMKSAGVSQSLLFIVNTRIPLHGQLP